MKSLWNPWKQPRLMLLGMEACEYPVLQIWAHQVVDGHGNVVCGAHTIGEAQRIRDRYALKYPKSNFFAE